MFEKLKRRIVYELTNKPEHYVHVDDPTTLQEKRQVQYNNWCKRYGVYNGSYLPKQPSVLNKKGWVETTAADNSRRPCRDFQRKSDNQLVRFDEEKEGRNGKIEDEHYHWKNAKSVKEWRKVSDTSRYLDRYGKPCKIGAEQTHLAPLDKDYNYKK